jgi:hypothetical protein
VPLGDIVASKSNMDDADRRAPVTPEEAKSEVACRRALQAAGLHNRRPGDLPCGSEKLEEMKLTHSQDPPEDDDGALI